jgi:hypothetical protein
MCRSTYCWTKDGERAAHKRSDGPGDPFGGGALEADGDYTLCDVFTALISRSTNNQGSRGDLVVAP